MFVKLFAQIYDSSVCEDWRTMVVFQQLLILADQAGVVDMTPEAIARRTNIPIDIIHHGIEQLQLPDPRSRSRDMDGRRIYLIDSHRDWGWLIVNYQRYRELSRADEKRAADRARIAAKRGAEKAPTINDVAECRAASKTVAKSRPSEAEAIAKAGKDPHVAGATRFGEFWGAYPLHENRKRALAVWIRKQLDRNADQIIADVVNRLQQHRQWREGYIPHPTTYLNGERWNDAIDVRPPRESNTQRSAAQPKIEVADEID